MQHFEIEVQKRTDLGKKSSRQLRKQDIVPCVLYGGPENVHFSVSRADLRKLIFSPVVYIVDIKVDKDSYQAVIKDIQFDPVSDKVNHIDFYQIFNDKPVSVQIPLIITGSSIGVREGGKLKQNQRLMLVKALPVHLPEHIEIDITNLAIGQSVKVKDVAVENVEFIDQQNKVLVVVNSARGTDAATATE